MRVTVLLILMFLLTLPAWAENIVTRTRITDSLPTNVLGTSIDSPPTIQVIRSKRGADYFIKKYYHFNNLSIRAKLYKLKKQFKSIDFSKYMVIAVLSQPMDNYKVKIKNIKLEDDVILVSATYKHELINYSIPPKKSIFYTMAVVKKMFQPVLLESKQIKVKSRAKENTKVTVTGRLMRYNHTAYQLVPVRIQRGKKNTYYIKGSNHDELSQYVGKVITLAGTVSHETDSPYEFHLLVDKLVRAHD